jgi:hypothetical protein
MQRHHREFVNMTRHYLTELFTLVRSDLSECFAITQTLDYSPHYEITTRVGAQLTF